MSQPAAGAVRTEARTAPRHLPAEDVADYVRGVLLSPARAWPVVGITTSTSAGRPWVDPERAARLLGPKADVVVLETGEATWELANALPERLDVYGGAARIWRPGLTRHADPFGHPLFFARSDAQGEAVLRHVVETIRPGEDLFPTPWQRVARAYAVGDVVWGLVHGIKPFGVFVELLPGVVGLVRKGEVDWTYVTDPGEFVRLGEQVKVQVLHLDGGAGEALLSIKRAWNREPRAPIPAVPGGRPLLAAPVAPAPGDEARVAPGAGPEAADLADEIAGLREDRANLLRRVRDLQKEVRSTKDRMAYVERQPGYGDDATATETAFLLGVRLAYARLFTESDRHTYPLKRMRVGPAFLERLHALDGVAIEKVLEVCAQVAADRAHEIPGREVHLLGERGAGNVERARDGAKAWRCSLQDNTASARRLHWWSVPGPDGGGIEFASVGLHDDYGIPE